MPPSTRPSQNRRSHYRTLNSLTASDLDIHLCWLPGHVGIPGNKQEHAERAAKRARRTNMQACLTPWILNLTSTLNRPTSLPYDKTRGPKHRSTNFMKLHSSHTHHLNNRRDQCVFNRCRIGHSRLTHNFLLKVEPPPECMPSKLIACVSGNIKYPRTEWHYTQILHAYIGPIDSWRFLSVIALFSAI